MGTVQAFARSKNDLSIGRFWYLGPRPAKSPQGKRSEPSMRAQRPGAPFLLISLLSLFLVSCFGGHGGGGGGNGGGGGGNGGGGTTTPGSVTIIEPTVSGAQVVAGSTLDFEAKVKGGNGMGVT